MNRFWDVAIFVLMCSIIASMVGGFFEASPHLLGRPFTYVMSAIVVACLSLAALGSRK